ncbi:HU family DNA-binding protein [Tessaracoccus sp. HF-7]|uniref:HU family DNA-binding protein n=1 Tax=Tessaracoccus caeni TaxID=3031239 RepID=UPI0023DB5A76|nr:HU family DNA-binding protein [Tessaracoccus caeni]MDF1489170.1 HU family DNA-binding protein [Tessaracoccus caeni]
MNKHALAEAVANDAGLDRATAEKAVVAVVRAVTSALAAGERVSIPGFGTFETRTRAARTGRNPQTGEPIDIPAGVTPAFKPSAALKQAVAGS